MSMTNFNEIVPTEIETDTARALHNKGYFQLSRKYRQVSRHYGKHYDPRHEGVVPAFSMHGWEHDVVVLEPGEFKAFFNMREEYDELLAMKFAREDGARHALLDVARHKYHYSPALCEAFVAGALMVMKEDAR